MSSGHASDASTAIPVVTGSSGRTKNINVRPSTLTELAEHSIDFLLDLRPSTSPDASADHFVSFVALSGKVTLKKKAALSR